MPSVRGRERIVVASLLTFSAASSGALLGFGLGVLGEALDVGDDVPAIVVAAMVAAVVALDRLVAPLSVRRQVPQLWGRVFSARTTAVLYGARLGVGPLTILRTWWWWLAIVAGALAGVWASVAVGVVFGAARIVVMLAVGTRAGTLRHNERFAIVSGVVTAVVLIAFIGVTAIATDDSAPPTSVGRGGEAKGRADGRTPSPTSPAPGSPATTPAPTTVAVDRSLAAEIPESIGEGYERLPDDPARGLGALDLDAAAEIEQDEDAERSLLETRHFVIGHARAWRHDDGRTAYVAAYRFGSPADADAYLVDGFITLEGRGARVYGVPEVPGGRGFSQAATVGEASEVAHGVAFVRGDVFFLAVVTSESSAATVADALALAQIVERT